MKSSSTRSPNSLYLAVLYGLAVLVLLLLLLWLSVRPMHTSDDRAVIVVLGGGLLASGQVLVCCFKSCLLAYNYLFCDYPASFSIDISTNIATVAIYLVIF